MSVHGTQNVFDHPIEPGARGTGISVHAASITLIGDDGTQFDAPRLREGQDPQPDLPPVRLACAPGCACWRAIEDGEVAIPRLSREQLVEWMAALAGPLRSGLAHNRMYHHVRSTKPESPLNVGFVGVARGLAAFGISPAHYRRLRDTAHGIAAADLIELFGGEDRAAAFGLELTTHRGLVSKPQLAWDRFCPLIWREGGEAAERLLG